MKTEYVVLLVQIVGNLESWRALYSSDGVRYATRRAAIYHGWRVEGHDDWLLAHLRGDRLVGLSWQYEDRDDPDELADVARQMRWRTDDIRD